MQANGDEARLLANLNWLVADRALRLVGGLFIGVWVSMGVGTWIIPFVFRVCVHRTGICCSPSTRSTFLSGIDLRYRWPAKFSMGGWGNPAPGREGVKRGE